MTIWESLILGIIQGLTEFLPVSSSGHLELANHLFGIEEPDSLSFTMAVHAGTVFSTILVFRKELLKIIQGFFKFRMNDETVFVLNVFISMIPLAFVGFMYGDQLKALYNGDIRFVGYMLLVTAVLLTLTHFIKPGFKKITPVSAFVMGLAQAAAVLPGLSRSGSTISTGLLMGVKKEEVAKFSFLMVLIPVIGMNLLEIFKHKPEGSFDTLPVMIGFFAAFVTGTIACKWMIKIVSRGKLIWFAAYCVVIGLISIIASYIN